MFSSIPIERHSGWAVPPNWASSVTIAAVGDSEIVMLCAPPHAEALAITRARPDNPLTDTPAPTGMSMKALATAVVMVFALADIETVATLMLLGDRNAISPWVALDSSTAGVGWVSCGEDSSITWRP